MALCSKFNHINYILFVCQTMLVSFIPQSSVNKGIYGTCIFHPKGALLFIVLKTVIVAAWSRTVFARQGVKVKYMNAQQPELHTESLHKIKPVIFPTWMGRGSWELLTVAGCWSQFSSGMWILWKHPSLFQ